MVLSEDRNSVAPPWLHVVASVYLQRWVMSKIRTPKAKLPNELTSLDRLNYFSHRIHLIRPPHHTLRF